MNSIAKAFSKDGPLAEEIQGFAPRDSQVQMAQAVHHAMESQEQLVVEAGTGTGKTFAYLIPALLSDKKIIVSTGTKNLQEQLYHRDLPLVKKALKSNKSTALLKGRANYLCSYRMHQHARQTHLLDKGVLSELSLVRKWATMTKSGDIGELDELTEGARILPYVTSTVDNCLGRDCPDYEDCYLVKARKKALESSVVVVNHHLFFADLALKDTGFGELVPEADCIVFDEAHQLPDIASEYFGEAVSSRQIQELCRDVEIEQRTLLKDAAQLTSVAEKLQMITADLRILFPDNPEKGDWRQAFARQEVQESLNKINEGLSQLYEVLKLHLGREKSVDTLFERASTVRSKLTSLSDINKKGVSLWYETTPRHIVLHSTPLNVADKFSALIAEPKRSWLFTSATLSVDNQFTHYKSALGVWDAKELILSSPFNYPEQAQLCIPRYLPEPNLKEFKSALVEVALKIINACQGRCFLLFTSHNGMRQTAEALQQEVDNPILVQGETSKRALLEQYLANPNAVLCGTGAFWEGVDVRGDDLICVFIDKLPFAAPDDPLLQARMDDMRKSGKNPFAELQIPQAVISLKQGAGRLIRDFGDRGLLVICDNRIVNRQYGATFLRSLPDMKRTRDFDDALTFLKEINSEIISN